MLRTFIITCCLCLSLTATETPWTCSFDDTATLPAGWTSDGDVSLVQAEAFKGKQALILRRTADDREKNCSATSPTFAITAGTWEFACASASDLESPDASFKGLVQIELVNAAGDVVERCDLADQYGQRPWHISRKRVVVPAGALSARFTVKLNKTIGHFRVDELSATYVIDAQKPSAVDRIVFSSTQLGNMLLPTDPRTFTITVESRRELTAAECVLRWSIRDYWGAEQAPVATVTAKADGSNKDRFRYRAHVDLAGISLATAKYYEIHAEAPLADSEPYRNWSSLILLPIAPSKAFAPLDIPFTARTWDNRQSDYLRLADRLGVRVGGIWGRTAVTPPHQPEAPAMDVAAELHMGVLTGSPNGTWAIEHHAKGYEGWTEEALRAGVRSWFAAYGAHQPGPLIVNLGNEPDNTGERLLEAVRAYKITYDEIKKVSPKTVVVATSIGAREDYFAAGYQDACDAFDFHVYESPRKVREAITAFKTLMNKYHCTKPIWSTEIGLNSQGMTRQYIAGDMARKTATFFAAGGTNMSWFGFMYPDPDAKIYGSTEDSFNMFDSRYLTYGPRLDAVMHYQLINGMLIKKFSHERTWKNGITGCAFTDAQNNCFVILWKDSGREDVTLALPGVHTAVCTRIDGGSTHLTAAAEGFGLTIGEDPLLLSYTGPTALPESLSPPLVSIASAPARLIRGVPASITVTSAADPMLISLKAPPAWTVVRNTTHPLQFSVTSPEGSQVREGDLLVHLAGINGGTQAELNVRPLVTGKIDVEIRPVPAVNGGQPAATLIIVNRSELSQSVSWSFALANERVMDKGQFGAAQATSAYLGEAGNGALTVAANARHEQLIPLVGIDPRRLYQATATVTDATGSSLTYRRVLGGFAGVAHASTLQLDGVLDEAEWVKATPCLLDQGFQYYAMGKVPKIWNGVNDLSANLRFLWDEKNLYVGVQVADDVFANTKSDDDIWAGDGLQFLFDPKRDQAEKPGKFDAGFAVGKKGPQAWYWLTASSSIRAGLQNDITIAMKRGEQGHATYEVAIPWGKLAPFTPAIGANLGACMIINEDDGPGRTSFIGWFGNPHTKQIDTSGDLILLAP